MVKEFIDSWKHFSLISLLISYSTCFSSTQQCLLWHWLRHLEAECEFYGAKDLTASVGLSNMTLLGRSSPNLKGGKSDGTIILSDWRLVGVRRQVRASCSRPISPASPPTFFCINYHALKIGWAGAGSSPYQLSVQPFIAPLSDACRYCSYHGYTPKALLEPALALQNIHQLPHGVCAIQQSSQQEGEQWEHHPPHHHHDCLHAHNADI